MIFYQAPKEVIVGLEPYSLSSSFYDTTLGLFGLHGYVLLISPFRGLNKVSVWVVKVEEEAVYRVQSTGTTIFPPSFAMFLSLKATLILYAKRNASGLKNEVSWLKKGREMHNVS